MKSFIKFKFALIAAIIGVLFSCKNQDGYSDEILTNQNPSQNVETKTDSIHGIGVGIGSAQSAAGSADLGAANLSTNNQNAQGASPGKGTGQSAGNGNGPAESVQDGAVKETPTEAQNLVPTSEKKK